MTRLLTAVTPPVCARNVTDTQRYRRRRRGWWPAIYEASPKFGGTQRIGLLGCNATVFFCYDICSWIFIELKQRRQHIRQHLLKCLLSLRLLIFFSHPTKTIIIISYGAKLKRTSQLCKFYSSIFVPRM